MPESEMPIRQLLDGPDGSTEIIFPDVTYPDIQSVSVLSPHNDTCAAIVMTRYPGEMRPVALDADDAAAAGRRLLQLAAVPDDDKRIRMLKIEISAALSGVSAEQQALLLERLLAHFEVFPRAAE